VLNKLSCQLSVVRDVRGGAKASVPEELLSGKVMSVSRCAISANLQNPSKTFETYKPEHFKRRFSSPCKA